MQLNSKWTNNLIIIFGIIGGISIQLNRLVHYNSHNRLSTVLGIIALFAIAFTILLWLIRRSLRKIVYRSSLPAIVKERYQRYDTFTYGTFLLPALGSIGIQFTFYLVALVIISFLSLQFFLVYSLMAREHRHKISTSPQYISFLFLISGFAALIYQIVWQRALFIAYGINIESVTIIVSIFMFGLGTGSIIGGILSSKYPSFLPQLFLICEVLIGLFGIASLYLIKMVSAATLNSSTFIISLSIYALLCIPTMLMGATLPILVAYLQRHMKNIGVSVGTLYSFNTAGSALACFITVHLLFVLFGQQTTVFVAALFNFTVGLLVYRYTKKLSDTSNTAERQDVISGKTFLNHQIINQKVSFIIAIILSAATGYISLSQEIIWIRAISYATGGSADVFANVLGFFLFGIVFGAMLGTRVCSRGNIHPLTFTAIMLFFSSVVYYFSMPINGKILALSEFGIPLLYVLVGLIAFLTGGIFPILCHFGIKTGSSIGLSVSWIYFANILGATAGPLLTGFILLDVYTLEQNIFYISLLTLIISGAVWVIIPVSLKLRLAALGSMLLVIISIYSIHNDFYSQLLEKLHYKTSYISGKSYKYEKQNRAGIIAVEESLTDIIYGSGVYDGRFNIDPVLNTNGIRRAYMVAALHPNPEDVLEIGLSSGSWTWAIASHKGVKKLTVVEINPGYLEIIKNYKEHVSILSNPKITIHIDDGRRWLNRNPDAKFDLIVSNTTFHWRSFATNILSEEFLRICKRHLKPGGVVYYNTTWSEDVVYTAAKVFKFIVRYDNFVAASDTPFTMSYEERVMNLLKFENNGKPIFDRNNPEMNKILHELALSDLSDKAEEIRNKKGLLSITDDNMVTEFKKIYNKSRFQGLYDPEMNWFKLVRRINRI